jgi:glycosidase
MQYEQYLFDYYSSYGSNYKYFFTGKIIERNSRKNDLLKEIVDIYKKWLESPFEYGVDLQYFDLNKLK